MIDFSAKDERRASNVAAQLLERRSSSVFSERLLAQNQALRQLSVDTKVQSPLDWGAVILQIPTSHARVLKLRYPDMFSPDAEISTRACIKFLMSPEAEPYRIRRNDGKRTRR